MMVAEPVRIPMSFQGFGATGITTVMRADLAQPYIDVLTALHRVHQRALRARNRSIVTRRLRERLSTIVLNLLAIEAQAGDPATTHSSAELQERVNMNDRDLQNIEREIKRNIILVSLGGILATGAAGYYVMKRG